MIERTPSTGDRREVAMVDAYEPPRVEQVLTPAELEEEIRYAGNVSAVDNPI